jgi:hypothetical protein
MISPGTELVENGVPTGIGSKLISGIFAS